MPELDGQVALVTGGGRGIGANIARELAAAGAQVAVWARSAEEVQATAREIGGLGIVADVTQRGGTAYDFTVTLRDDVAINVGSLGTGDVRVTGPGGFSALPSFLGVDLNTNGTPRTPKISATV